MMRNNKLFWRIKTRILINTKINISKFRSITLLSFNKLQYSEGTLYPITTNQGFWNWQNPVFGVIFTIFTMKLFSDCFVHNNDYFLFFFLPVVTSIITGSCCCSRRSGVLHIIKISSISFSFNCCSIYILPFSLILHQLFFPPSCLFCCSKILLCCCCCTNFTCMVCRGIIFSSRIPIFILNFPFITFFGFFFF